MSHHPTSAESFVGIVMAILGGVVAQLTNPESYLMKMLIFPAVAATVGFWTMRLWKKFVKNY